MENKPTYTLVLALTHSGVIGTDCPKTTPQAQQAQQVAQTPQQIIPWDMPDDLKNFRAITATVRSPDHITCVLMGAKTYKTIAPLFPKSVFPGRVPVVLSTTIKFDPAHPEVIFIDSINPDLFRQYTVVHVIGGAGLVNNLLAAGNLTLNDIHLTHINHDCVHITPELNPVRVDMDVVNQLLASNYTKSPTPDRSFTGKCTLCNADITGDYYHYKRI
ncbi:putative bifunctional dihydrofolate reductase-thymidylate synthase [Faustovirus]|nr:putative bifunctional dihydrofolate reductase-thymidylate synthase [Faustovirus]